MRTELSEHSRADLRRTLGEMESLSPLAPELDKPVAIRPSPKSRPRPILVALGSAAVVFAAILPIALLGGAPEATENDPSVAPPTLVDTTAPPDPDPAPAVVDGWAITDVDQLGTVIEATDQGFVAISGNDVRTSSDGIEWETAGGLGEGGWAYDLEWRDGILVTAGAVITDDEEGTRTHTPAVWTSTDHALTWTRSEVAASDITVTPDGFAAVGVVRKDESDPTYNKTRGVLWTSVDGLFWTRVVSTDDPEGVSSSFRNVVWQDGLIILGHRGPDGVGEGSGLEDEPHQNVTWFSDGTDLSDPVASDLLGHLDADQTAVTPHGIIAMTHRMTPTVKTVGAAWISQDGLSWTELDIASGNYEYTDVGQIGDKVFVTGYDLSERDDTGMWSSSDGTTWARVVVPELSAQTMLQQVEVTESAMVIAGDNNRSGFIAGRPHP